MTFLLRWPSSGLNRKLSKTINRPFDAHWPHKTCVESTYSLLRVNSWKNLLGNFMARREICIKSYSLRVQTQFIPPIFSYARNWSRKMVKSPTSKNSWKSYTRGDRVLCLPRPSQRRQQILHKLLMCPPISFLPIFHSICKTFSVPNQCLMYPLSGVEKFKVKNSF